jgi:surfactin family lipopeptide synthetase A
MTASTLNLHPSPAQEVVFFPASFGQQRLWFIDQLTPGRATYNMPSALRIRGELSVDVLERTLQELTRRHETLRTRFVAVGGEPQQIIEDEVKVELPVLDLTRVVGDEKREAEAMRQALEEAQQPFDLQQGPLFRAKLLTLGERNHVLLFTMHHIISDVWSMGVLVGEVSVLYGAFRAGRPSPLPELPIQYADYSVWQRECLQSGVLEQQLAYWKQQLAGSSLLKLPTDRSRPATQSQNGAICNFVIAASLTQELKQLAEQQGATLFMVLLAAFQTLLYRYSGQHDIAVGTPIAGRSNSATEKLIGFFVNTLVLRVDLSGAPSFTELLQRTKKVTLEAYANQDVPFEKLVEVLSPERDLSRSPLFQVSLVMWNAPWSELELGGAKLQPLSVERGISRFDLTMTLDVGTGQGQEDGRGSVQYSTDLFEVASVTRMIDHYQMLLSRIVENPSQSIAVLPLLTTNERKQVIEEWNQTDNQIPEGTLLELFAQQVQRSPGTVAVTYDEQQLSYGELNERANQMAWRLRELGVGPETRVGLMVERSLEMVVGMLGVLKAGAAYVPLDPGSPRERLEYMIEDSGARLVVSSRSLSSRISEAGDLKVLLMELEQWHRYSKEEPQVVIDPAQLAYVIYTSGSTGRPKGVGVEHRQLVNYVHAIGEKLQIEVGMRLGLVSTHAADLGYTMIFPALCHGGCLDVVDAGWVLDAGKLEEHFSRHPVDYLKIVPSHLRALLNSTEGNGVLPRRWLIVGGEASSWDLIRQVKERGAGCRVLNHYGPTETTVGILTHDTTQEDGGQPRGGMVPVGRPLSNGKVYILDSELNPVGVGVRGEIYIGGAGVARGYWKRADLTAEKFLANPYIEKEGARMYRTGDSGRYMENGNIEFLGRKDEQVKIRGFRVELGEIEAALKGHPKVREAVVVVPEDEAGEKRLVAYVVPEQESGESGNGSARAGLRSGELQEYLGDKLPEHMVPSAYVQLKSLPLTANGKLDRNALPAPEGDAYGVRSYEAPVGEIETALAAIWAELLKVERVGRHDNFFALGGHSLLDIRMRAMIRKRFHYDLPLAQLFQHPCIAELAKLLEPVPEQLPSSVESQPPMTTTTLPKDRKDNGTERENAKSIPDVTSLVESQPPTTTTTLPKDRKDNGPEGKSAKWIADVTGKRSDRWIRLARQIAGELPPGSAVLDVAPGPGYFCIELAKLGSYAVSGLDISHTLVEIANKNAAEAGVVVDFRQGSASSMPFADNTFDFLRCSGAFKQFGQPVGALQEMYRVLKPGGRGVIKDLRRDASWRSLNQAIDTWGLPLFDRILAKFSFQFLVRKDSYTKNQFQMMLTQTKFRRTEIEETEIEFEISVWK